jgi:aryl-alcohol dehydrogenase-like predicted oxidoreductase
VLDDLVQAGKLKFYGVSVEKVEEAIKATEYPNVQSIQIIFNMFRQRPAELFFGLAQQRRVGILARVPLASGLLSGKMTQETTFPADDHRNFNRYGQAFDRGETFSGVDYDTALEAVEMLRPLVPPSLSLAQFALRWILMFDAVSCAIPGAKNARQALANAQAADLPPLSDELMAQIRAIYDDKIKALVHQRW